MYALVDCNNFYVSCERSFQPHLKDQPVIVLSNNDGCVISRSDEAKLLIPMGAPFHRYKAVIQQNNINIFSSNYALYGDMSHRVMSLLQHFTPDLEIYSIDEAFLYFNSFKKISLEKTGQEIHKSILKGLGIPTCVGLGPTKTLAKIANKIARKFPKECKGTYVIDSEEKRLKALKWLKIEQVWGIGKQSHQKLKAINIDSAYDFIQLNNDWIQSNMSIIGLRIKNELLGVPSHVLDPIHKKKSIAITRSFEKLLNHCDELSQRMSNFAILCTEKIRKQGSTTDLIEIFITTDPFNPTFVHDTKRLFIPLDQATDSFFIINQAVVSGLKKIFKLGCFYKKAGVVLHNLKDSNQLQLSLFEIANPKHDLIMKAIDDINLKIGTQKIKFASQYLSKQFIMKQNFLSKKYTTSIDDIITVHCNN